MKEKIINFPEGIPGFEYLKQFILLEQEESSFCQLQSIEQESIAFVVVNPYQLDTQYAPHIHESYFERLGGGKTEDFVLYSIVTLGETLDKTTVNLKAPLLIQVEKRIGLQVFVEDNKYKMKQPVTSFLTEGRA